MEAQICGVPVVVNNATSLTELAGPFSARANPAMSMLWLDGTQIAVPNVITLAQGLEMVYQDWKENKIDHKIISSWAEESFNWDNIYNSIWKPILNDIPERVNIRDLNPKLVLGCGNRPGDDAVNHDLVKHSDFVDIAHDLTEFPYPWNDNEFGFIKMEDVIEHLNADVDKVINELWRVLKPNGCLMIVTVEAGTWQHHTDPTHVRGFTLNSFDYFDNRTQLGKDYGSAYEVKPWKILKSTYTPHGELFFLMQAIKNES